MPDRIQQAFESGEKNQQTLKLVQNWCAHARLMKMGGTGIVEQMSGLPVGHHGLACDYAAAGGMATWDLADAALDFYDRNCATCAKRKAVGLPNLSSLVAERDARERTRKAKDAEDEARVVAALEARRAARRHLRSQLDPLSATVIDQIEALDIGRDQAAVEQLCQTARLAPEIFTSPLVEHLFTQLEASQFWIEAAALEVLSQLNADPARVAACAMKAMRRGHLAQVPASTMRRVLPAVRPDHIPAAMPALIQLASPRHEPVFDEDIEADTAPLLDLHRAFPHAVTEAIESLINGAHAAQTGDGARAVQVLATADPVAVTRFSRAALSKLATSHWLQGEDDYLDYNDNHAVHDLQRLVALAYEQAPADTEVLIAKFLAGASVGGQARILAIYRQVLGHRWDQERKPPGPAQRMALKRMIWAATEPFDGAAHEAIREVFSHYVPDEIEPLLPEFVDELLSAAVLLDDTVLRFDAAPDTPRSGLEALERRNERWALTGLQEGLVAWAVAGAKGDVKATGDFVDLVARLPEDREGLKGRLVSKLGDLAISPRTLGLVLSPLYSALAGSSTVVRGAGATAVGEMKSRIREDAPLLLLEAFVALLHDPFVYVENAAVEALQRFTPPEELKQRVGYMLFQLISWTASSSDRAAFLVDCIELFIGRHVDETQLAGKLGAFIIKVLDDRAPSDYVKELQFLQLRFAKVPAFGKLVVKALGDGALPSYLYDHALKALQKMPEASALAHRAELATLVDTPNVDRGLHGVLVETLTRAGAWSDALSVAEKTHSHVADTPRERVRRLNLEVMIGAVRYEQAIAEQRLDDLKRLGEQWRDAKAKLIEAMAR